MVRLDVFYLRNAKPHIIFGGMSAHRHLYRIDLFDKKKRQQWLNNHFGFVVSLVKQQKLPLYYCSRIFFGSWSRKCGKIADIFLFACCCYLSCVNEVLTGRCFHVWNYFIKAFLGRMRYRLNYCWECTYHRIIIVIYLFVNWNSNLWWILERKCSLIVEMAAVRPYQRHTQWLCVRVGLWRLEQPWNVHADDFPQLNSLSVAIANIWRCDYYIKAQCLLFIHQKMSAFMWICLYSRTHDGAEVFLFFN